MSLDKLNEITTEIERWTQQRRELAKSEGGALMHAFLTEGVFNKFPLVESVYWTQYTPGFCDGDPCTFSLGEININYDEDEGYDYNGYAIEYQLERGGEEADELLAAGWTVESAGALSEVLAYRGGIRGWMEKNEGFLEDAFGDPVLVIVKRDGTVETDEYDPGY